MVTRGISRSIASQARPQTQMRTAKVLDVIEPSTSELDVVTGWQVKLDFGGGEVANAGVAATYTPIPGDVVTVMTYLNALFVVDKIVGGTTGDEPGGRLGYAQYEAAANGVFATAAISTEVAVPSLELFVDVRNGAAYEFEVGVLGIQAAVANSFGLLRLRQDGVGGADLGEFFRVPTTQAGVPFFFQGKRIIRNDTGFDFNVHVALTLQASSAGTASAYAGIRSRPFVEMRAKGSSKLYPHAAPLDPPPDEIG